MDRNRENTIFEIISQFSTGIFQFRPGGAWPCVFDFDQSEVHRSTVHNLIITATLHKQHHLTTEHIEMASSVPVTTVSDLVSLYTSGQSVPLEDLDKFQFQDALTVRRDMQSYKKRTYTIVISNRLVKSWHFCTGGG